MTPPETLGWNDTVGGHVQTERFGDVRIVVLGSGREGRKRLRDLKESALRSVGTLYSAVIHGGGVTGPEWDIVAENGLRYRPVAQHGDVLYVLCVSDADYSIRARKVMLRRYDRVDDGAEE